MTTATIDIVLPDRYEFTFDSKNPHYYPTSHQMEINLVFLRGIQQMMNDILAQRGHVFLNDVLQELGFPHTQSGAVVGWLWDVGAHIDLGVFGAPNADAVANYLLGPTKGINLTFNVQGIIFDKI